MDAAKPLKGIFILLDPGHGGSDSGAVGPTGLKESTANLRVARYLGMLLKADGAKVKMTRETDRFVSLKERVEIADNESPDLFVSVHHNASVRKTAANRAEIYFNALEQGIPLKIADSMAAGLTPKKGDLKTEIIPGGFFVLRNNQCPAVLTEGSYISIKSVERGLKSSRGLTTEAQKFRMAIRKVFEHPPVRVEVFSKRPAVVTTAFPRFIFAANKTISRVQVRLQPNRDFEFSFAHLPILGESYLLYNNKPLPTGSYTFSMLFYGIDGTVSRLVKLPVQVKLPIKNSVLLPVAPYIATGMDGDFPLTLVLQDANGRLNPRSISFNAKWGNKTFRGMTNSEGKAAIVLPLTGKEEGPQTVEVEGESEVEGGVEGGEGPMSEGGAAFRETIAKCTIELTFRVFGKRVFLILMKIRLNRGFDKLAFLSYPKLGPTSIRNCFQQG